MMGAEHYININNGSIHCFNPSDFTGNYSATSNNTKLVHWPMMGGLLHLVQQEGPGRAAAPPSLLLAVPNVTAHTSTASVPITVLLYDGPLLCGFNVAIEGLTYFLVDNCAYVRARRCAISGLRGVISELKAENCRSMQ